MAPSWPLSPAWVIPHHHSILPLSQVPECPGGPGQPDNEVERVVEWEGWRGGIDNEVDASTGFLVQAPERKFKFPEKHCPLPTPRF